MEVCAMALSMDEQRMLAEIEARLSAEEPGLAARLSSFRRPSPAAKLRSPRGRVVGSMFAVALAVVISLMVYAMIPFRAHAPSRGVSTPVASGNPAASAPVKPVAKPATSSGASTAKTTGASSTHHADASAATSSADTSSANASAASTSSGKAKTSTGKTGTSKTGTTQTGNSTAGNS
jgi:cytoskeletal protein RodZ